MNNCKHDWKFNCSEKEGRVIIYKCSKCKEYSFSLSGTFLTFNDLCKVNKFLVGNLLRDGVITRGIIKKFF